ncbi:MAG: hypothetical protein Alis3KO_14850 [Aliiglaciecola sp.]
MHSHVTADAEQRPLVSVVIPVYNREEEITGAIKSLNQQTYRHFEVIFVDDYSTVPLSNTLSQLDLFINFPFEVLRNKENSGVSYSRNQGVRAAKGQFIAFLDSDDQWYDTKLERCVDACLVQQKSTFCMSKTRVLRDGYEEIVPKANIEQFASGENYLFVHGHFAQVSAFFLSSDLAKSIKFDESLSQYEDFLYFIHGFNSAEQIVFVDETLVVWNDESSQGRLSQNKAYNQATTFIDLVSSDLARKDMACFYLRYVIPYYFYQDIRYALACVYRALIQSEMSKKAILWMTFKGVIGDKVITAIRGAVKR